MKEKGFTLIELLAVIVILAIIALIATPIVLSIIDDAKESSMLRSAEMYINAVELSIANNAINSNSETSAKYEIIDSGKKIKNQETNEEIKIEYKGNGLTEGIIETKKGKVTKLRGTKINGKYAAKVYDKIEFFDELPESTLIKGANFNTKIKKLVSGEERIYSDIDEIVTSIKFLSYGRLPEGYTKEELLKLKQVDVSNKQDGSILALYDGEGNVFIYSEKLIFFNENSSNMFIYYKNVKTIEFGLIDTSEVTNMSVMFAICSNLTKLDLNNFNTSNVNNMSNMFKECSSLTELDVSNFDTIQVTNMSNMFHGCSTLSSINVSNFNTSQVTNMSYMFSLCYKLTELDVSNFDTSNVTNMSQMFSGLRLTKLDLSSFDTSGVTNMLSMFQNVTNLTLIEVSDKWVIGENTTTTNMFSGCGTNAVTLKQ